MTKKKKIQMFKEFKKIEIKKEKIQMFSDLKKNRNKKRVLSAYSKKITYNYSYWNCWTRCLLYSPLIEFLWICLNNIL